MNESENNQTTEVEEVEKKADNTSENIATEEKNTEEKNTENKTTEEIHNDTTSSKKARGWRFYLKVFAIGILLLSLFVVITIFTFLNKLASNKNFEKLVTQKASEATGMVVEVQEIGISFPSIELKNVHVATDSHIMKLESRVASVKVRPDFFAFIKGNVVINYLGISSSTTTLQMKAIKSTDVAIKENKKTGSSTFDLNSIVFPFKSIDINDIAFNYIDDGTKSSYNLKLNRACLSQALISSALPYEIDAEWLGKVALKASGDLYWPRNVISNANLKILDINEVKKYIPKEYQTYLKNITGSNVNASLEYSIDKNTLNIKNYIAAVEPLLNVTGSADIPQMSPLKLQASASVSPVDVSSIWPMVKGFVPPEHGLNLLRGSVGADVGVMLDGDKPINIIAKAIPQKIEVKTKYLTDNIVLQKGNVIYDGNKVSANNVEVVLSDSSVKLNSLIFKISDLSLDAIFAINLGLEGLIKNLNAYLSDGMKNLEIKGNLAFDGNVKGKVTDISSIKVSGNANSKLINLTEKTTKAKGTVEKFKVKLNSVGAESGTITVESLIVSATGANLNINGTVKNQKDIGFNCAANGSINVEEFSRLAKGLFNLPVKEGQYKGGFDVSLKLDGTVSQPKPSGKIVAKNVFADVSDYGLVISNFNGTVTADNDKLILNNIKANALGGDLDFNGTFKDFKNMKVEAVANVKGTDLAMVRKLIGAFVPDMPKELDFSGKANLNASLSGSTSLPKVKGSAQLIDGKFVHPLVFRPVEKINGRVDFDNNGLSSNNLSAYWGTSKANVSGSMKDWAKFITNFKFNVAPLDVTDAAGFFLDGTGFKVLGSGIGSGTVTGAIEKIKVDCLATVPVGTLTAVITEGGDSLKFPYQELKAKAVYHDSILDISSASLKLFEGDINAKGKIFIASDPIRYAIDTNINQLQTQSFLRVNADKKYEKTLVGGLDGFAKLNGDVTGLNSINGNAKLGMASGTYDSPDIVKKIADKLNNPSLASGTINNVSGDYTISKGRISSNNVMGTSDDNTVTYVGSIGLDTTLDGSLNFELGKETCSKSNYLKEMIGDNDKLKLSCKVKGSLTSPNIDLPLDDLLKSKAKNEIGKILDKNNIGGDKTKNELGKVADKIGDGVSKLGKGLKKIFK